MRELGQVILMHLWVGQVKGLLVLEERVLLVLVLLEVMQKLTLADNYNKGGL
tara:strand:- start:480 stop:635 length:156 start_codon:yes stop_codon:yes gene_type:complete